MNHISSAQNKTIGQILRLDPALDNLIEKGAKIEVLGEGFVWSEGPAWVKNGGQGPSASAQTVAMNPQASALSILDPRSTVSAWDNFFNADSYLFKI